MHLSNPVAEFLRNQFDFSSNRPLKFNKQQQQQHLQSEEQQQQQVVPGAPRHFPFYQCNSYVLVRAGQRVFDSLGEIDALKALEHDEDNFFIFRHSDDSITRGDSNTPKYEACYKVRNEYYKVKKGHLKLAYSKCGKCDSDLKNRVDMEGIPYWVDRFHAKK